MSSSSESHGTYDENFPSKPKPAPAPSQDIVDRLLSGIGEQFDNELTLSGDEARALHALITTLTAERDAVNKTLQAAFGDDTAALLARVLAAEALVQSMREAVEQAFRDGIAYASMVKVTDVDLAWEQSRARAALSRSEV